MKKIALFSVLLALVASACMKVEQMQVPVGGETVRLRICTSFPQQSPESKVALGEDGQLAWSGDESATLVFGIKGKSNSNNPVIHSVEPGIFEGEITIPEGFTLDDLQGIVVPSENGANFRGDHSAGNRLRMFIPAKQTQKNNVFNPAYCPLFSPLTKEDLVAGENNTYVVPGLQLKAAADMVRFSIYGAAGENVKSVRICAIDRIAATVEINLEESGYGTNGSNVIDITVDGDAPAGTSSADGAKLFCNMSLGGDRHIHELRVVTDKAEYVKYVDVTMPVKKASNMDKLNVYPVNLNLATFTRMDKEAYDYYYRKVLSIAKRAGLPSMQITYTEGDNMMSFVAVNEDFYAQDGRKQENAPLNTTTVYQACSMSKVPLAYIAMKMVEEGKLDLMKPVYQYWADYTVGDGYVVLDDEATITQKDAENAMLARFADETAKAKAKLITSKMILLHTTGLDNGTYSGIRAVDDGDSSTWEWLREPDYTTYLYSGPAIHILDMTLGKILGKDLKDYSIDYIFDKVGIVHANYLWQDEYSSIAAIGHRENGTWSTSSSWNGTNAAYTLRTSTEEYTKFLKWINTGADFTDKANYDAMFANYGISTDSSTAWQGLVWRMEDNADIGLMYHHRGNNGNYKGWMCTIPSKDKTLVFMTNGETSYNFYQAMAELFLGHPTDALKSTGSELPSEETDSVGNAGEYDVEIE